MSRSRALVVALVAAGLLVVVLGVDLALNRTVFVEVDDGGAWRQVAASGPYDPYYREPFPRGPGEIAVNRSDDLTLRLRVDNGYPWAYAETFRVYHAGDIVAEGTLTAASRGEGNAEFTVPAERFFPDDQVDKAPVPQRYAFGQLDVEVGSKVLYAHLNLQEVPR